MKQKDWERRRQGILYGWRIQLLSRETTIEEQLGKFTFAVTMRGEPYIAHVLVNSFDFYERRLHLRRDERPITLLICDQHDTCVSVHVEALGLGQTRGSYEPYQLPAVYTPEKRGTALGAKVLLGQLLKGTVHSDEALAHLAPSTRAKYLARMVKYLKQAPGRTPSL